MDVRILRDELLGRQPEMLDVLRTLVEHESPSSGKAGLDSLAGLLAERFRNAGARVELLANPNGGDHILARLDGGARTTRPALILGHFDTVWPVGTLAGRPFRIEEDRAFGPGIFDMKAGLVLAEFALRALRKLGHEPPRPLVLLFTADEEIGSPTSRSTIESTARDCEYVLVLEPPLPGGALKTARKGVGRFTVEVEGRPAHAGIEPEKGVSAIQELAHQVLRLHALNDLPAGTTINVGLVRGGTTPNVVAAHAVGEVDVRVRTMDEARRIESALRSLDAVTPGAIVRVNGGFNRPPMERTPPIARLFEQARDIGRSIDLDLAEGSTGGGSDGNFTAALGVPTLDGLGVPGAGAHAEHEHIEIATLAERAALIAALILGLGPVSPDSLLHSQ
jgi:glutamate carboxypeptidase